MRAFVAFRNPLWMVLGSFLCMASMWLYVERVLIMHQISDAAAHARPRGTLSDLYPRWLGARELLLHGRDPYSAAVTREIQMGYYGRPLDSARPYDPKDQQRFAYPVYVVFFLAPTIGLPFEVVQKAFFWVLVGVAVGIIPIWLRFLRWPLSLWSQASVAALTLGSLAVVQALKLQQMTLVVAALIAAALALLRIDRSRAAGVLLALATIKPQLVAPLLLWLAMWTASDIRRRYHWTISFLITMAVLFGAAELWLPGWLPRFWQAVRAYQEYTGAELLPHKLLPVPWNWLAELGMASGAAFVCCKNREQPSSTEAFAATTCAVLAVTLLIVPTLAIYNQVLLLPALLMLARDVRVIWSGSRSDRVLLVAVFLLVGWQWVSSIVLAGLSFVLRPETVQDAWAVPGWTALTLPVAVAALMLILAHRASFPDSRSRIAA